MKHFLTLKKQEIFHIELNIYEYIKVAEEFTLTDSFLSDKIF